MIFEKQVLSAYRGMMYTRCDDNKTAYYFSAADFPGLKQEAYPFSSSRGHRLQGYLYQYENPEAHRLVVFEHGFGGGHRSYMKEIELLCRRGYRVFAYDHTGCMESGGETPNGMAQSLCDLNACITALKADPRFAGTDFSVVGHSWGGFSTMNIAALHPEISHLVVLAGFVSVPRLVGSFFGGIMKGYQKPILALETEANPIFSRYDGVESLRSTQAKVLLIYSDNDAMVRRAVHYDLLEKELAQQENIRCMLVEGKNHNPNYTKDAAAYLGEYTAAKAKLMKKSPSEEQKKEFVSGWDWDRMTAQDESVWDAIFACLEQ